MVYCHGHFKYFLMKEFSLLLLYQNKYIFKKTLQISCRIPHQLNSLQTLRERRLIYHWSLRNSNLFSSHISFHPFPHWWTEKRVHPPGWGTHHPCDAINDAGGANTHYASHYSYSGILFQGISSFGFNALLTTLIDN